MIGERKPAGWRPFLVVRGKRASSWLNEEIEVSKLQVVKLVATCCIAGLLLGWIIWELIG